MKVMLDTNVLISAFIFKSKTINEVINILSKKHEIIIASYCFIELYDVINNKFNVDTKKVDNFLHKIKFTLVKSPINIKKKLFTIRDENDYIILHTAIIHNVDILITGDKDFKEVFIKKPKILTPKEFLEEY